MLKLTLRTDMTGCCDTESTRYALGGVLVEAGTDPIVTATDSRILAITRGEGECSDDIVVPHTVLPKNGDVNKANFITTVEDEGKTICQSFIAKAKKYSGEPESLAKPSNAANVVSRSGAKLEGRFPRYRDIVPSMKSGDRLVISINPSYLVNLHKAITTGDLDENSGLTMVITMIRPANITKAEKELRYRIDYMEAACEDAKLTPEDGRLAIIEPCLQSLRKSLALISEDVVTATNTAIFCDSNAGVGVVMPMALGEYNTDLDDAISTMKTCIQKRNDFCGLKTASEPVKKEAKTRKERKAKAEEAAVEESTPLEQDADDEEADPALVALVEQQAAMIQELMASLNA
jgi:hypothetical protein